MIYLAGEKIDYMAVVRGDKFKAVQGVSEIIYQTLRACFTHCKGEKSHINIQKCFPFPSYKHFLLNKG